MRGNYQILTIMSLVCWWILSIIQLVIIAKGLLLGATQQMPDRDHSEDVDKHQPVIGSLDHSSMADYVRVEIITVAKVGSSDFLYTLKPKYRVIHNHETSRLEKMLKGSERTLFICGIRNPLDQCLSHMFQRLFIPRRPRMLALPPDKLIEHFFNQHYDQWFNSWFERFFSLTSLQHLSFDHHRGYEFYHLGQGNSLLMYTLEQLDQNKGRFATFFEVPDIRHHNNSAHRCYRDKYEAVKATIEFPEEYVSGLLDTQTMRFFYSEKDIERFRQKYDRSQSCP